MSLYLYVKSFLWLAGFGGLGYGLMRLTEPSQEKIEKIRNIGSPPQTAEQRRQKELLIAKLKEAATSTPIYLRKKGEE